MLEPSDRALTHRQELVLATLASRPGVEFAPVQVQKLFFLIDENIAEDIGGKQFAFEPYDYGPFDKNVYLELEQLEQAGLAQIAQHGPASGGRRYELTPEGQNTGAACLRGLSPRAQRFIARAAEWVCKLSFAQLVGSIYKAYPHMRENSIFVDR